MIRFVYFFLLAFLALPLSSAHANQDAVDSWCNYLVKRLHSVSRDACNARDFISAQEFTTNGNVLVSRDFGVDRDSTSPKNAKRILLIGGIHGDELTSVSIVFRWMDLIDQPDGTPYHWRVIPLANPDGLKARPSTRFNGNGVDLNRNFNTPDWEKDAQNYWIKRTKRDPRRNPGKTASSEIETRWLEAQIEEFKPDLIISVHAPYNLLDYDGPVPHPMRFGRLSLNRLGVYPGSLGNYGGLFKQIPVVTIELPNATSMPSRREQLAMWHDMLDWMKKNDATTTDMHSPNTASNTGLAPETEAPGTATSKTESGLSL